MKKSLRGRLRAGTSRDAGCQRLHTGAERLHAAAAGSASCPRNAAAARRAHVAGRSGARALRHVHCAPGSLADVALLGLAADAALVL